MLGLKTFMMSSRLSSKDINKQSELRQRLSMEHALIRVVFDNIGGLAEQQIYELFKTTELYDSALRLPYATHKDEESSLPLQPYISRLIKELQLDQFGGVSTQSKHVKASDPFITSEYILFKLLVGSVAGIATQEYSKISKDPVLPNKEKVSDVLNSCYFNHITTFLNPWLSGLKTQFSEDRTGYHLSPQVWFALGLVIHQLAEDKATLAAFKQAGRKLGQLDYSKVAKHWGHCDVMELDSNGRIFKNSAKSTREFRRGLANYFLEIILGTP